MKNYSILYFLTVILFACNGKSGSQSKSTEPSDSAQIIKIQNTIDTTVNGVTFNVSSVKPADSLLKTYPVKDMMELKIEKKISFLPDEHKNERLIYTRDNGFIETLQYCYDEHRPLKLSPDHIWTLICQATSIHINQHYDSLKNIIFTDEKKEELIIRNDSLENNARYWGTLIKDFCNETKNHTRNDLYDFFVPNFSTTTPVQTTVYQITLLESYKKKFSYVGETGCGIPQITITGNKEDWIWIFDHLSDLDKLGLTWWGKELRPIIKEFINVFDDKINVSFWDSIYKDAAEYGAFYISGWIIKFFPYLPTTGEDFLGYTSEGKGKYELVYRLNPYLHGNDYKLSTLGTESFPSGLSQIDIKWINYFNRTTKKMKAYSGFFGVKQSQDKTLEPFISWLVCKKDTSKVKMDVSDVLSLSPKHHNDPQLWSPRICNEYTDSAIYDIKRFKSQQASLLFIRNELNRNKEKYQQLNNIDLSGDTLRFVITCDGSVAQIKLKGRNTENKKLIDFFERELTILPESWMPALAHPDKVLDYFDFSEEELKLKVKANSELEIVF